MAYKPEGSSRGNNIALPPALRQLIEQTTTSQPGRSFNPASILDQLSQPQPQGPPNYPTYPEARTPNTPSLPDPRQRIMQQISELLQQDSKMPQYQPQQLRLPQFDPVSLPQFDPNRFKKQATQSVNEQFNPIINDLIRQQGQAQGRATSAKQELGTLYGGLSAAHAADAKTTQQSYDATQAQSKALYDQERNRIAAGYAADQAAQRQEAKRLGTEALGVNEAIAAQNADKQFADQMQSQQMQSTQGALGQQEAAAMDYDRSMAQAAKYEGAEAQRDVMSDLEDYMSESATNIAGVKSQAAGSITDLMNKLAEATYQRDAQNAQFGYQQQRDYIGDALAQQQFAYQQERDRIGDTDRLFERELQAKMAELEMLQNSAGAGASGDKLNPWQQVATFAESLRPGQGQDVVSAIQGAMNERPEIYARSKEDPVAMNPALFAKLIADSQSAGSVDRNTLMMVSQELYRLLYGV